MSLGFCLFFLTGKFLASSAGSPQDFLLGCFMFATCNHYLCGLTQWHILNAINKKYGTRIYYSNSQLTPEFKNVFPIA